MKKRTHSQFIIITILTMGSILMILPFVWMLLSSFKPALELLKMPPTWFPEEGFRINNYKEVLRLIPFHRYMLNSILLAGINTIVGLFACSLTGYIFAKYKFKGQNIIFILVLGSMMIPFQVIMIPMYSLMVKIKWVNSHLSLTIPYFYSIFGVFLMRQFMIKLPNDLIESAFIDGCSHFRIYFTIIIPLIKTAISTLGIFLFMASWNDYLWPLIVINKDVLRTIPLGLGEFVHARGTRYDLLMAASVMAVLPIIIVFFAAQRNFIEGISMTGIKS